MEVEESQDYFDNMSIDLKKCDQICFGCVKSYKKKHTNKQKFAVTCDGIPLEYIAPKVLATLSPGDAKAAVSMLDPVTWANEMLDWHCIDENGAVWKRKSKADTLPQGCPNFYDNVEANEVAITNGKSPFNRPYQAEMLRCSARYKVFRIGRQAGKTEALVISMLYAIFTNHNFKVVLLAPFQAQINMIFKRVREHLESNPELYNSKKRIVAAPNYELELFNGSYIRGFTAGTSSKAESASARGQSAHMLVFDEADYLSSADITTVLATVTNNPDATVWMSSTPSGKRQAFYDICHSTLYKEFHYSSHINPLWSDNADVLFREQYTEIEYQHEILAEFGQQAQGVFQVAYVEAAQTNDYEYAQRSRQPGWQYCFGVDWNDVKIGTTIVVTGWNPDKQRFEIVTRETVSRVGWNQLAACEKIIEMNRVWIPEYIYIDRGYGATQDEILRQYGSEALNSKKKGPLHVDARLANRVKQYDFGSQIEIRDLHTKQPIKKHAKPFLVENTIRKFEAGALVFPRSDEQLEAELLGYVIDRITTTGVPVYKQGNEKVGDHTLDALMLSLVGFQLEFTAFGRPKFSAYIAFSGQFGNRVDPVLYQGERAIKQDDEYSRRKRQEERMPSMGRTSELEQKTNIIAKESDKLPAANTTKSIDSQIGLWSWPGFSRDAPKPSRAIGPKNSGPPKRKKF